MGTAGGKLLRFGEIVPGFCRFVWIRSGVFRLFQGIICGLFRIMPPVYPLFCILWYFSGEFVLIRSNVPRKDKPALNRMLDALKRKR